MFSKAVPVAAGYTRPVVISSRTAEGKCGSAIGAYIVLNRDGWILTAGHLLGILRQQQESARRRAGYRGERGRVPARPGGGQALSQARRAYLPPARGVGRVQPLGMVGSGRRATGRSEDPAFRGPCPVAASNPSTPAPSRGFPSSRTRREAIHRAAASATWVSRCTGSNRATTRKRMHSRCRRGPCRCPCCRWTGCSCG